MASPFDWMTAGQWLVLLSFFGAAFCTKSDGIQKTAIWFSCLFAVNYIWLKWTAHNLEPSFYGFYLLRVMAELFIVLAVFRHANRLSKWLIWAEAGMIAANLVAMAAPVHEFLAAIYPYKLETVQQYKKATILALESLQVFGVFFCISPVYRYFVERNEKKDCTWLARQMHQSHT